MDIQTEDTSEDGNKCSKSIGAPGSPYRHSGGAGSNHIGGKTRRYSMGITSSQKSNKEEGNMVPNYLRASTGSCHDFCKYGKKHEQSKSASPIKFKRTTVVDKDKVPKTVVPIEGKKTTTVAKPVEVYNRNVSYPSKKLEVSKRVLSKVTENELKTSSIVKPKPSSSTPDASNGRIKKKDVGTVKKTGMTPNTVGFKKVAAAAAEPLPAKPSVGRSASLKARKYKNVKVVSPLKDQNRMQKTDKLKQPETDKVQMKTLHVVEDESEAKPETIESEPVPPAIEIDASISVNSRSSSDKEEESIIALKTSPDKEVLEEESSITTILEEEFEYTHDDEVLEESECTDNESETSVGNHKKAPRKGRMVISDEEAMIKLKFRRGKVLDLQSESNGPRKLKFRKGRIVECDQAGQKITKRTFEKKETDHKPNDFDSKNGSESVVLKHQGEQGKKDAQGLFNNVIEETASKLVESRKSKVKALVGAFETVISLQDGKPAAT